MQYILPSSCWFVEMVVTYRTTCFHSRPFVNNSSSPAYTCNLARTTIVGRGARTCRIVARTMSRGTHTTQDVGYLLLPKSIVFYMRIVYLVMLLILCLHTSYIVNILLASFDPIALLLCPKAMGQSQYIQRWTWVVSCVFRFTFRWNTHFETCRGPCKYTKKNKKSNNGP
jgi:hypothetical protein